MNWQSYTGNPLRIEADTRTFRCRGGDGKFVCFRPRGALQVHGDRARLSNPVAWSEEEPMLAARIFVGLKVGDVDKWTVDDVVKTVKRVRTAQVGAPDASFVSQKGLYTHEKSGEVVEEDSVQVVILNTAGTPHKEFVEQIVSLAEMLALELDQESVIVEIQKGGVHVRTLGVAA